jgi:hypothetical protein
MIPQIRKAYNENFTEAKYDSLIRELSSTYPGQLDFRVAETPLFIPADFRKKMISACESIVDFIVDEKFDKFTRNAIPPGLEVPGDEGLPHFIAFDFGICVNGLGEYEPQLIEMQGFPSLFCWEVMLEDIYRKHFPPPAGFSPYLSGYDRDSYLSLLKEMVVGTEDPDEVILLEIFPNQQKTRVDFYCTRDFLGIRPVCLTELIREGKHLYYLKDGGKTRIKKIYNRLIFDDLRQQPPDIVDRGKILFTDLDVTWIPHPNWFYRISKFTIPFIEHPFVPETFFLNEVKQLPRDLGAYVVKPLFSFAGQGVIIDVTPRDIDGIQDPQNWILQRKVKYAEVIETPDQPAKAEIRIFYFWKDGMKRPVAVNNLARLSKGKMVGVRYNQDKQWVGGSFCYFEQ